jgi:hypothetical protein
MSQQFNLPELKGVRRKYGNSFSRAHGFTLGVGIPKTSWR